MIAIHWHFAPDQGEASTDVRYGKSDYEDAQYYLFPYCLSAHLDILVMESSAVLILILMDSLTLGL